MKLLKSIFARARRFVADVITELKATWDWTLGRSSPSTPSSRFVDLAPTSGADDTGIVNSYPEKTQVSLLNKWKGDLTDEEVRNVLRSLHQPLGEVATIGKSPTIPSTTENRELAIWLRDRKLISSFADGWLGGIRIYNFKK